MSHLDPDEPGSAPDESGASPDELGPAPEPIWHQPANFPDSLDYADPDASTGSAESTPLGDLYGSMDAPNYQNYQLQPLEGDSKTQAPAKNSTPAVVITLLVFVFIIFAAIGYSNAGYPLDDLQAPAPVAEQPWDPTFPDVGEAPEPEITNWMSTGYLKVTVTERDGDEYNMLTVPGLVVDGEGRVAVRWDLIKDAYELSASYGADEYDDEQYADVRILGQDEANNVAILQVTPNPATGEYPVAAYWADPVPGVEVHSANPEIGDVGVVFDLGVEGKVCMGNHLKNCQQALDGLVAISGNGVLSAADLSAVDSDDSTVAFIVGESVDGSTLYGLTHDKLMEIVATLTS
jgi:hypothetical protein